MMDLIGCKSTASCPDTSDKIANKYAVKLLGLDVSEISESDLLNDLLNYVLPSSINALMADNFNNFFILFLTDIDSVCKLIQTKVNLLGAQIRVLPLVETYVIHCVYPFISNDQLKDIFRTYGTVLEIHKLSVAPNSSMFSHVISSKCEISFLLPGTETELYVSEFLHHPPFKFTIRKLCCACLTEGHSILYCPDIDYDSDVQLPLCKSEEESDVCDSKTADNSHNSLQQISLSDVKNELIKMGVESSCASSDTSSTSNPSPCIQDCCKRRLKKLKFNLQKRSSRRIKKTKLPKRGRANSRSSSLKENVSVKLEE